MAARYTRLPTDDRQTGQEEVAFDFSSAFQTSPTNYKSIFKYTDGSRNRDMELETSVVKESLLSRICSMLVTVICTVGCVLTFPISIWFSYKVVSETEKLVVFRLGRFNGVKGPGLAFLVPCIDRYKVVDTKIKAFNVPPLQILTCDGGIVEMGADIYYQVTDVVRSVTSVQDMNASIRTLVRTTLTNHLAKMPLSDIQTHRANIVNDVQQLCNKTIVPWGLIISRVEFSPIKVLQEPVVGASLPPGLLGGEALPQAVQHLAHAFLSSTGSSSPSQTTPAMLQMVTEGGDAAVGASSEDVKVAQLLDPRDLVRLVRGVLSEPLVRSVKSTYQFNVSGPSGGTFYLDLKHGSGSVGEGPEPSRNPDATLEVSQGDIQEMFAGTLKPLSAYMSGRLKVSGDLSAAMELDDVIQKVKEASVSSGSASSVLMV